MKWTAYKLIYQAKSPIHIGWHTLGYIKLTRYYITGKAMWGVMTANLARTREHTLDLSQEGNLQKHYENVGSKVFNKDIFVSYFYPALDHENLLLPHFTDKGLMYGDYSKDMFEQIFIKSYGQTAVLPDTNTAEDETLHESEYIAPMVEEDGTQKQVYFVGYVFMRNDSGYEWSIIKKAVTELFMGGDRKYGWGRLMLDEDKTGAAKVTDNKIFDNGFDEIALKIILEKDKPIPAHLSINTGIKLKGDIEPLVGREWSKEGFGGKVETGVVTGMDRQMIFWVPGSVSMEGKSVSIGEYGILVKAEG